MLSIDEARKLLGNTGKQMTDEGIIKLQNELTILSNILIDQYIEDKKNGKLVNGRVKAESKKSL